MSTSPDIQPAQAGSRLVAYIGSYGSTAEGGGIHVLNVSPDGRELVETSSVRDPLEAGYLVHSPRTGTLYAVDERKNDGRGPVAPAARVHALAIDPRDGSLAPLNAQLAPGPWLFGETFTAADILWASALDWTMKFGIVPRRDAFEAYVARLMVRPAIVRAAIQDEALARAQSLAAA